MKKRGELEERWGNIELAAVVTALLMMFFFNWRYVVFYFLPFFVSATASAI